MILERIDDIQPLLPTIDASRPSVPVPLVTPLFGTIEQGNRNPHTFAVLDGASVKNLPDLLSASGLEHACLFKNKAAEALRDVAPWLVKLERESRFTTRLFTAGDAPWHLWGKIRGTFLRSEASCSELSGHLRKFTRLPDEQGKWYYFRYWDQATMAVVLRNPDQPLSARFLAPLSGVIAVAGRDRTALHMQHDSSQIQPGNDRILLTQSFRELLQVASADRFDERLRQYLSRNDAKFARLSPDTQRSETMHAVAAAQFYGLRIEAALARFARIYISAPKNFIATRSVQDILTSPRHELDRVNDLARHLRIIM